MRLFSRSFFAFGLVTVAVAVVACSSDETTTPAGGTSSGGTSGGTSGTPVTGDPLKDAAPVVASYVTNVHASYNDALTTGKALQAALDAFITTPSEATQKAAKDAWVASRKPYTQTEGYRFYEGPIDNETDGPEGELNSWPLDENFIDYTRDDANAGIINTTVALTKELLKSKNTDGGEKNISTGYHAIEFLLWGQDDIDPMLKTQGHRSFTDYTTAKNADRRKMYLKLVAEILVEDLQKLVDAWAPDKENYAKTFGTDPKEAITKMLTGIGSLANAELSGERMIVAYKDKDQEDEHSCFSDTTNADLQNNFISIQNVYLGTYGTTSGAGISTLVAAANPTLDTQIKADLATTAAAFTAMQADLFDFAIKSGDDAAPRMNVLAAIKGVQKLAGDITMAATALGVTFEIEKSDAAL